MNNKSKTIAVLMGGVSSEREVSIASGKAIVNALSSLGYNVIEHDISSTDINFNNLNIDLAFIALHGQYGEDGTIQAQLENMKIPFTGSCSFSSKNTFDKIKTRKILEKSSIPIAEGEVIYEMDKLSIDFPIVLKPPREGSSVGCNIVMNSQDYEDAYIDTYSYSKEILVEKYIHGRELTVGIIGDKILPVLEIFTADSWYNFDSKYKDIKTTYEVPANLEKSVEVKIKSIALDVYKSLGARDFARIDFRLSSDNKPYVLELNSIPGFTKNSLLPKAAAAVGINFINLCQKIVEIALARNE